MENKVFWIVSLFLRQCDVTSRNKEISYYEIYYIIVNDVENYIFKDNIHRLK